jgi:protein TonB
MPAAVALSAVLHVFLIYGFSLPAESGPAAWSTIINAHLAPLPSSASPQHATMPGHNRAPDPVRRAELLPIPHDVVAPLTAPEAAPVAADPDPVVATSDAANIPSIPDPIHYPARDLDIYPQALNPIRPVYPQEARAAQIGGSVTLLVLIDEAGRVVDTSVADAAPGGLFEQAAMQAMAGSTFYPAQKDGRTVRSRILVKLEFDPAAATAAQ